MAPLVNKRAGGERGAGALPLFNVKVPARCWQMSLLLHGAAPGPANLTPVTSSPSESSRPFSILIGLGITWGGGGGESDAWIIMVLDIFSP